ncbi:MAG: type 1 glutamine amidotransferase [Patescibacteria group bacterium]
MNLKIGYFYPDLLNLYGDNGNVEILAFRANARNINVSIEHITLNTTLTLNTMQSLDLIFMGGGPDAKQKALFEDLLKIKGSYLLDYLNNGGVGLFICGSYQLLGHYYKTALGEELPGLGYFDLYTQHFGNDKPRCIGNVICELNEALVDDTYFNKSSSFGDTLVGFENHGGRTYLGIAEKPLATIKIGHGNNAEDFTEGAYRKNAFGTYLHGPVLSKNPQFADYLIAKSLKIANLSSLNDVLIAKAHTASKKLNQ